MINYIKGNVLQNSNENRVICHIVNNKGGFGKGFALQVKNKYPIVRDRYKDWYHLSFLSNDHTFKLGTIQKIDVDENLSFINMLCQDGYKNKGNTQPLVYDALELCLLQVNESYLSKQIWMPKIGIGLAGGEWSTIEEIIERCLSEREVFIYEL